MMGNARVFSSDFGAGKDVVPRIKNILLVLVSGITSIFEIARVLFGCFTS